jgi:hypothetical protein
LRCFLPKKPRVFKGSPETPHKGEMMTPYRYKSKISLVCINLNLESLKSDNAAEMNQPILEGPHEEGQNPYDEEVIDMVMVDKYLFLRFFLRSRGP